MQKISVLGSKKIVAVSIVTIICIILIVLDSTIGGTGKFYASWVSCGQKPVVTKGSGFLNDNVRSYYDPGYVNLFPGYQDYYCSAADAERANYSANENYYDFPNLERLGEEPPIFKN